MALRLRPRLGRTLTLNFDADISYDLRTFAVDAGSLGIISFGVIDNAESPLCRSLVSLVNLG
jgi:hypothetical protein